MTQQEHSQQYIEQLQDSNQIPFLLVTLRADEYPDGDYFGVYSSFQNVGLDEDKCLTLVKGITNELKQEWDLPTKKEIEEEVKRRGTKMQTPRYKGVEYNGQSV